jgi:hypothetical protein
MVKNLVTKNTGHEERGFIAKKIDGTPVFISLVEIDAKLKDSEKGNKTLFERNVNSVAEIIPTEEQINLMAGAIQSAVVDELGGLGNNVKNLASSALGWTKNAITGTNNENEITGVYADKVRKSSMAKLANLVYERSDLRPFLSENNIKDIGEKIYENAIKKEPDNEKSIAKSAILTATTVAAVTPAQQSPNKPTIKEPAIPAASSAVPTPESNTPSKPAKKPVALVVSTPTKNDDLFTPDPNEESVKTLDESNIEGIRKDIADHILKDVEDKTAKAINENIVAEKDKLRKGGWFDSIQGFFFKLLDALGLGDWIAELFSPTKDEITQVSHKVGKTVSETLTAKDFINANGETIKQMSPEELNEAVKSKVAKTLQTNRQTYSSFDDKDLEKIATEAGSAVAKPENFNKIINDIPKEIYGDSVVQKTQPTPIELAAAKADCKTKLVNSKECNETELSNLYQITPDGKQAIPKVAAGATR